MHFRCLAILLLASLAVGQAPSATPSTPASKPATPASNAAKAATSGPESVAPGTPVITIEGMCDTHKPAATKAATASSAAKKATATDCKTVVTRAQFDALADALQPKMPPATKRKLADLYPKMLIMAHAAKQHGLENDPNFNQILQFARLQILSQQLSRSLKDEADKVPDSEIEKYYKDNSAAFEQATLQRLFIPKDKQTAAASEDSEEPTKEENTKGADAQKSGDTQKSADAQKAAADKAAAQKSDEEALLKKEADSLQARASAGEDFDKLQKEAYDSTGLKGTPPATNIGKLTHSEIPVTHRAVMDLKPGQVSQVLMEPNGYYIYKVVSKEVKPLQQVHDEIRNTLAQQRLQDTMEKIQQSAKIQLNDAYFAVPPNPPTGLGMPPMGPGGRPGPGAMMPGARPMPTQSGQGTAPTSQTAPAQGQRPPAQSTQSNPDSTAPKN